MFDPRDEDQADSQMKDKLLMSLIDQMHDLIGSGLKDRSGMGVEVQAETPEALKAGLEKAGDVVDHAVPDKDVEEEVSPEESDESDMERLKELFGDDKDEEEDKFRK